MKMAEDARINLDAPRYDQTTYEGRARHFFVITNPMNVFCTSKQLEDAKQLVQAYRERREPPGTTADQIWNAKHVYDSAFHPDTGEKMFLIGRMSAQVPMNMTITGCMMTFYRTTPAVIFWQWINQSFNAVVNYTNRSGKSPLSNQQLGISYCLATGAATGTALLLNRSVKNLPPLVGRYVPFAAVAAANCINIPFMRSKELQEGTPVFTKDGTVIGNSPAAAKKGITQVVVSRIVMAMPGMAIPPLIINAMEKKGVLLKRYPWMTAPLQVGMIGVLLVFATPMCCAIFPQMSSIAASKLESDLQSKMKELGKSDDTVYFNKGL